MLKIRIAIEEFYGAKKPIIIWDINVNVDNIVISRLIETKNNSKYLTGYLDKVISPLVLKFPKMSGFTRWRWE